MWVRESVRVRVRVCECICLRACDQYLGKHPFCFVKGPSLIKSKIYFYSWVTLNVGHQIKCGKIKNKWSQIWPITHICVIVIHCCSVAEEQCILGKTWFIKSGVVLHSAQLQWKKHVCVRVRVRAHCCSWWGVVGRPGNPFYSSRCCSPASVEPRAPACPGRRWLQETRRTRGRGEPRRWDNE